MAARRNAAGDEWFFVSRAVPEESPGQPEFEVQVLNSDGTARDGARFSRGCRKLYLQGQLVPPAVLEAAEQLVAGLGGEYVLADGQVVTFAGEPNAGVPNSDPEEIAQRILELAERLGQTGVGSPVARLRLIVERYGSTKAAAKAHEYLKEYERK